MIAQSVVPKKQEKLNSLFEKYGTDISESEFVEYFQKEYPKDWERIQSRYNKQERKRKPGKYAPMPAPIKYLENMYKVNKKKQTKK